MEERYIRNLGALTEAECALLREKTVLVAGWSAQAAVVLPGDGLMERIYPEGAALESKASLPFTPPFCAALQTALCVRLLTGRGIEPGKLYMVDLLNMEFAAIF